MARTFDWPVNDMHSQDDSFLTFADSSGFSITIASNQLLSLASTKSMPVQRHRRQESFLSLSPSTSPLSSTFAYQYHVQSQSETAPRLPSVPSPAQASHHSASPKGSTREPANTAFLPSSPSNEPAPVQRSIKPECTQPRTLPPRTPSAAISSRAQRFGAPRPPALRLQAHARSASEPPSPSPSSVIDSFALPSVEELQSRRLNKLRKHLSESVPADLIMNTFARPSDTRSRKALHRESSVLRPPPSPPPPHTSSSCNRLDPEIDYQRLLKLRRHLSTSVPAHLVLRHPPRCESLAEEDEDEDEDAEWSEDDQLELTLDNAAEFDWVSECSVSTAADQDPSQLEFEHFTEEGAVSVEVELGSNLFDDEEAPEQRAWPPSAAPWWPASPSSIASSFAPVRVERKGRREKIRYNEMLNALRSLR